MSWWARHLNVGGVITEAMGIAASVQKPALQVLVVPGNPGLCSFYSMFMEELHELFSGTAHVWCVSHAGHDSANLNGGKVYCLSSQISHKASLLREHVLAPGKPPAVILAHSIGSYMMLQAIKQLEETAACEEAYAFAGRLVKVVLLMPFLATDWASSRQCTMQLLSGAAPVLGGIGGAVSCLPQWLQDLVVRLVAPEAEACTRRSMTALMGYSSVKNYFHLAWHEFRDLDLSEVDWALIRRLGPRAAVVCAPNDVWFPLRHYQQMQQALPELEEVWHQQLSHAFCTDRWQSAEVARLVADFVATSSTAEEPDVAVLVADRDAAAAAAAEEKLADALPVPASQPVS